MKVEELFRNASNDLLQEPYCYYAEVIGIKNLYKLAESYGGCTLYIPMPKTILKSIRDERIKKEFTGYNYSDLAHRYEVCERTVRNIVNEKNSSIYKFK